MPKINEQPLSLVSNSNLITNEPPNTLAAKLNAILNNQNARKQERFSLANKAKIRIISAYFNAAAFEFMANFSDKIATFELIFDSSEPSESENEIVFTLKKPTKP